MHVIIGPSVVCFGSCRRHRSFYFVSCLFSGRFDYCFWLIDQFVGTFVAEYEPEPDVYQGNAP